MALKMEGPTRQESSSLREPLEVTVLPTPWSWPSETQDGLLTYRTGREIYVVLSHQTCGCLLLQLQETHDITKGLRSTYTIGLDLWHLCHGHEKNIRHSNTMKVTVTWHFIRGSVTWRTWLLLYVVGRIMAPQRCPHANSWNLCYFIWQEGIKVADGIKFADQLTSK